jgi:hypothetical protein
MCGQTFAVAYTVPDLSTATRMSWPAAKVGLSVFGLRVFASHTFTHEFFTGMTVGAGLDMATADRPPTRVTAGPWKARAVMERRASIVLRSSPGATTRES